MGFRKEIKRQAKSRKFGMLLLSIIIASAVQIPFQALTKLSEYYSFLAIYSFLGSIVTIVLIPVFTVGVKSTALKVSRGAPISAVQPFKDGLTGYGRKFGGTLWKQLLLMLWSLFAFIPIISMITMMPVLSTIGYNVFSAPPN